MSRGRLFAPAVALLLAALNAGYAAGQAQVSDQQHGTVIGEVVMYVSPDVNSSQVARPSRGRDTWLMGRSVIDGKPWAHIMVTMSKNDVFAAPETVSGWADGRLVITSGTPKGDEIIFGEAMEALRQSENGRKNADQDAMRLFYRIFEYFPKSPLAAESLYHAADLEWQLERAGVFSRPSSREMSPDARGEIDEEMTRMVIKKFPHTKWADLAAYNLLDNRICGGWKNEPHCPEKETELYEHYAHEYPQSPRAAEALYKAAWRQAALVDMYKEKNERDKSEKAKRRALAIIQEITSHYQEGDWKPRALQLQFALQQGLQVYTDAKSEAGK
jgi:hypothetical protein